MRKVTYYVSSDGKKFSSKDVCMRYESNIINKELKNKVVLLDKNQDIISVKDLDSVKYIIVKSKDIIPILLKEFDEWMLSCPWDYSNNKKMLSGLYYFDHNKWLYYPEEEEKLKSLKELLNIY